MLAHSLTFKARGSLKSKKEEESKEKRTKIKRKKKERIGGSDSHYHYYRETTALKFPTQCPLVLLVTVAK